LNYPENPTDEDKDKFKTFFYSLEYILPCPICGYHFKENMNQYPIRLDSREELFNWSVDMHNQVNKANNKRELSYTEAFEEVINNSRSKNIDNIDVAKANLLFSRIKKLKE
jgi:hypothetical protein